MSARIWRASIGACLVTVPMVSGLAASPWRPDGPWVAALVVLVVLPAATSIGVAVLLRGAGHAEAGATARLAAIGAPPLAIFAAFALTTALSTRHPGALQASAMVIGAVGAAALAARFTGPEAAEDAATDVDRP